MADHLIVGFLIGIVSGIAALIVIAAVTLRRFDSMRHAERARLRRALGDLQRTVHEDLAAVRRDLESTAGQYERQTEALTERLAGLTDGALATLRDHPLPALGRLAEAQERRLGALAGELTRLSGTLAADAATHATDLRNELLESLKVQLEEVRAAVDEKLEGTVERRLGESFRLVSQRLELVADRLDHVHRGLGEVQTFAAGLGHLQRAVATVRLGGSKAGPDRGGDPAVRPRAPRRKPSGPASEPPAPETRDASAS